MSNVIILGGPKHETRIRLSHGTDRLRMAEAPNLLRPWSWREPDLDPQSEVEFRTLSYPIISLTLSPERAIKAALHPDMSETTGRYLLADLVYAAWEKYGVSR